MLETLESCLSFIIMAPLFCGGTTPDGPIWEKPHCTVSLILGLVTLTTYSHDKIMSL